MWSRVAMLIEWIIIPVPLILFIVKVMEWSGDYLILVFFLVTGIVKLVLLYLYPRLIAPLFSSYEQLPEYAQPILDSINWACRQTGFSPSQILLERSYDYDVHANASCSLGRIVLAEPLFKHHG